jgi:endonuclease/exonuclease/phosphatase family metal-dependent hydrolase
MTYAVFERKSNGEKFIHVNTHLATDKETRNKQVPILLSLSGTLLEKYGDLPIYFTGDFNMTKKEATYSMMLDWMLDDTRYLLDPANTENTCGDSIIDYCFVGRDDFTVEKFDVGFGLAGSDHYPVYVEMYIK